MLSSRVRQSGSRIGATAQVAGSPVGGPDVVLGLTTVSEAEDAPVLEKAPENADDANPVREPRHPGAQTADAPNHEIDLHSRLGGAIQRADHVGVRQAVELGTDATTASRAGVLRLTVDERNEALEHLFRRDQQPAKGDLRRPR